ncbi:MAG TPA: peptidoglycan editing factor PgeF [Prevotella sp.]
MISYYDTDPHFVAFSTTRQGGQSSGNFAEFNINEYCGDDPQAVQANREALATELGIDTDHLIVPHQVHGIDLLPIAPEYFTLPLSVRQMLTEGMDGVMTAVPGVCIGISTADCIPVLLYDTEHRAACAVHAGWRGTVARIVQKAVADMRSSFGTSPSALKAIIGPGISLEHFEVGNEVYDAFAKAGFEMEKIASRREKWHLDLPLCNQLQLQQMGLDTPNIYVSNICTYAHADQYFSARRLGTASGRIYTGILIK